MLNHRIALTPEEKAQCRQFAQDSAPTQREWRSGGELQRSISQINEDTFRGKVAEVVAKKFFEQNPLNVQGVLLDFNVYPRGEWDETDLVINKKKISIKSAKWFSNWLLLETKDIDRGATYDYYVFITVDKDFGAGTVKGFATKQEIVEDDKTLKLRKGDPIPGTKTLLDANNHARHAENLHNSEKDWLMMIK